MKTIVLTLMTLFAVPVFLTAQGAAAASHDSDPVSTSDQKPEVQDATPPANSSAGSPASPLVLKDAGPASTEDLARRAAHNLAKGSDGQNGVSKGKSSDEAQKGTATNSTPSLGPPVSEVGEFHPAPGGSGRSLNAPLVKDPSPLKRVHGDVYGGAGRSGHAAGGDVGATSKSGKTSVYVESDQERSKAPQPQ